MVFSSPASNLLVVDDLFDTILERRVDDVVLRRRHQIFDLTCPFDFTSTSTIARS
jgi:hypothetical protein